MDSEISAALRAFKWRVKQRKRGLCIFADALGLVYGGVVFVSGIALVTTSLDVRFEGKDVAIWVGVIAFIKACGYFLHHYALATEKSWAEIVALAVARGCQATGVVLGVVTVVLFLLFGWSSFVFFFTLVLTCVFLIEVVFALETFNVLRLAASYRFSVQSKPSPPSSQE